MRKLVVAEFLSLDGVMQAPGDPNEDPEGGFAHGGWQLPYADDALMKMVGAAMAETDAQLFGRKTYEIFANYWPNAPADDVFAQHLNQIKKYVASRTLRSVEWSNAELLEGDVPSAVSAIKELPGRNITVLGSGELVRTLMEHDLVDEYSLMISPILIGSGKRLFGDSDGVRELDLVDAVTSSTGTQLLTYRPKR